MGDTGGTSQKYPGITSPISLAEPKPLDLELSKKVEEAMTPHGYFWDWPGAGKEVGYDSSKWYLVG